MERVRVFIALSLPVEAINRVARLQRELKSSANDESVRIGWVPPPNMHVTLKFLGEIDSENTYAIRHRLRERLAERAKISLQLRGVGVFPDAEKPRVIWLGLHPDGEQADPPPLVQLAQDLDGWLAELGFASEKRPYHPHLTLGRVRTGEASFWQEHQEADLGRCEGTEIVLYRSELRRAGAEYTAIERFSLLDG